MTTPTWPSPASAPAPERRRAAALALLLACASGAWPAAAQPRLSAAADASAAGMVEVRELAPDLVVEMRYAGADNFTGAPVPGYEANRCYLLRPAAEALARVQAALRTEGLGLVVYDCYRPAHAVRHFVAWARGPDDPAQKARWYPGIDKPALLDGYIAETSGHSRGATVDLTLARCVAPGRCAPLDMGTPFDFFDTRAHTDDPRATPAQRANRDRLRAAMAAQGLRNYPMEWWHYTLHPEPDPATAYDFPVR
ncbi:MAG TPA: M15 family metallopeptidase [Pseudoxanthomonas sp.]|nr:M15 family metallopeptidase [Pseudoxanthomonas sp.]